MSGVASFSAERRSRGSRSIGVASPCSSTIALPLGTIGARGSAFSAPPRTTQVVEASNVDWGNEQAASLNSGREIALDLIAPRRVVITDVVRAMSSSGAPEVPPLAVTSYRRASTAALGVFAVVFVVSALAIVVNALGGPVDKNPSTVVTGDNSTT